MISFNNLLLATSAALIAIQVEANPIHNSCLKLTNDVEGHEVGEFMTNEETLTSSGFDDEMRLHSFTTCYEEDKVMGIQFFLALDPYTVLDAELIPLTPIGQMVGTCDTIKPTGPLDKIRASGGDNGVTGIRYYTPNDEITYGSVSNYSWKHTDWQFKADKPLMGLFGRQSENGIEQLGFIKLKMACQSDIELYGDLEEPAVEPLDGELTEEPESSEQINEIDTLTPEEHTELEVVSTEYIEKESASFDITTLIVICVAIVIFVALLVGSIKYFHSKKSQLISVRAITNTVTQTPSKYPNKVNTDADIENQTPDVRIAGLDDSKTPAIGSTERKF